jgi:hypothetical protein
MNKLLERIVDAHDREWWSFSPQGCSSGPHSASNDCLAARGTLVCPSLRAPDPARCSRQIELPSRSSTARLLRS